MSGVDLCLECSTFTLFTKGLKKICHTCRHEFGHFLLWYRDPKRKHTRKEETICKMMERTLLKFPHLKHSKQKSLLEVVE